MSIAIVAPGTHCSAELIQRRAQYATRLINDRYEEEPGSSAGVFKQPSAITTHVQR